MPIAGIDRATGQGPPLVAMTALYKGALAIAVGDLMYKDASDHYDKSAAGFTWNASLSQTQIDFKAVFRGVSTVRRTVAQTTDGSDTLDGPIWGQGRFCFPCDATTATYVANNAYVTIAQGTGNTLDPAKVVVTTNVALAIGRLAVDCPAGITWITFDILPATVGVGGPQTIS